MIDQDSKIKVVQTALKKMYDDGHFSICTIDRCIKLMNIVPPDEEYNFLSVLHCVDFKKMSKDIRAKVLDAIMIIFSPDNISFEKEILEFVGQSEIPTFIPSLSFEQDEQKKRLFGLIG